MNFVCKALVSILFAFAGFQAVAAENDLAVSCGDGFYVCLTSEDLKSFSGKTLKYTHPRAVDFGTVTVILLPNGVLTMSNGKGSSGGTWEINDNKIDLHPVDWGKEKYSFKFVRISGRLFVIPNYATGGVSLTPVQVVM